MVQFFVKRDVFFKQHSDGIHLSSNLEDYLQNWMLNSLSTIPVLFKLFDSSFFISMKVRSVGSPSAELFCQSVL